MQLFTRARFRKLGFSDTTELKRLTRSSASLASVLLSRLANRFLVYLLKISWRLLTGHLKDVVGGPFERYRYFKIDHIANRDYIHNQTLTQGSGLSEETGRMLDLRF